MPIMEALRIGRKSLADIAEKVSELRDDMDAILEELEILLDGDLTESIERGKRDIRESRTHSFEEFRKAVEMK